MQSDLDLLKMAAKAAGLDVFWRGEPGMLKPMVVLPSGDVRPWNPLEDDGDAMRIAVKLGIGTRHHIKWSQVFSPHTGIDDFSHEGDPMAATRRAIVRAAAMTKY